MKMVRFFIFLLSAFIIGGTPARAGDIIEHGIGGAITGALLGYAVEGKGKAARRGAAAGAVIGILTAHPRHRGGYYPSRGDRYYDYNGGYAGDDCAAVYGGNPGAMAACRRGQEREERRRQYYIERRAYEYGRAHASSGLWW